MKGQAGYVAILCCATLFIGCGAEPLGVGVAAEPTALEPRAHLHAGDGDVVLSGVGTATIDGRMTAAEWNRAGAVSFTLAGDFESHPSTIYVMNDESYLYVAVVISNEDYSGNVGVQGDVLDIHFDNDHDGGIAFSNSEAGDDIMRIETLPSSTFADGFECRFPCPLPPNVQNDIHDGGSNDVAIAFTHTSSVAGELGTYTFEFRKKLDSGDAGHDFQLKAGDVVGVFVSYVDTPPGGFAGFFKAWPGPSACIGFGRWDGPPCVGADIRIAPSSIPVQIDIKPGSFPNSINPRSNGVTPVAVLTTSSFAASSIDPGSIRLGAAATRAPALRSALEDVDRDGDVDMVLHFDTRALGIECGHRSAVLTGRTMGGQPIEGADSIKPVGCK